MMREILTHIVEGGPPTVAVFAEDELGPGGAPHHYEISLDHYEINSESKPIVSIDFQMGGVIKAGGINGVSHEALLAILIDRLEYFQAGQFRSPLNESALRCARESLEYLQRRTRKRIERGVEGRSVV